MQFSKFYDTNLQLLFQLFLFYSHTRELVFDCFQSQDFQFLFDHTFFHSCVASHHYFPNPKSKTVHCDCARERGRREFEQNLSDQWHVLISSALSLSCLIKQWPFPPAICLIPTVPKCTFPILLKKKTNTNRCSSVSSTIQAFWQKQGWLLPDPLSSYFPHTSYFVFLSSSGSDSLASHRSQ